MALKVIKISKVKPSPNSSHDSFDSTVLPLTFFDLRWLRFHPTERLIFYKLSTNSSHESFNFVILPKLELSLSLVLCHYTPLAGCLKWNPQDLKPCIIVSPDGYVPLTIAESDADFFHVSGKGLRLEREIRSLVPELVDLGETPSLISIQITLFPNQGFCIGITAHHSLMDGRTMAMFIKSWAHTCKNGTMALPKDLTPVLDRNVINVPDGLDAKILDILSNFSVDKNNLRSLKLPLNEEINPDVFRIKLELTPTNIEKLKERAKSELFKPHLSTFVVVNAYLWTCLVNIRGGDMDRPIRFMYAADFRNRLNQPVPETYFGNCVFMVGCFGYKANVLMGGNGFVNAVEILSDSVKGLSSHDIEKHCELYINGIKRLKPDTQTGSIAGSNRLGLYASDFGWGKPVN